MVRKQLILIAIAFTLIPNCGFSQCAKFEPADNTALLIIGQDLGANGGFSAPDNQGYHEQVNTGTPAGVTTYTGLGVLNGLKTYDNYGAGNVCAQCIINNPNYTNSTLAIGLYMVNQLGATANGIHDSKIDELANWIKATKRPVFLRIGYEFEYQYGSESPQSFINAYKRIVDRFNELDVTNCAYVWQAAAGTGSWSYLSQWYPGDDYVDWFGYSHFAHNGSTMISIARSKGKPVMIAEATPINWRLHEVNGTFAWNTWFQPVFDYIEANKDVIKAFAYINQNWDIQPLWYGQNWGNSRVQDNSVVLEKWITEINKPFWIKGTPTLFDELENCGEVNAVNSSLAKSVSISPNPTLDHIHVENTNVNTQLVGYTIQDASDQYIHITVSTEPTRAYNIHVGDLPSGLYILKLHSTLGDIHEKIVKL